MDGGYTGMLEASGVDVCDWLLSDGFEARLFTFFPCTDILPSVANKVGGCSGGEPVALFFWALKTAGLWRMQRWSTAQRYG